MAFANTFDALNAKAAALGERVFHQVLEEKDIEGIRSIIADTEKMYDGILNFVSNRSEHAEWYKFFMDANIHNNMHKLDRSGEFTRIVEEMKTVDTEGYYFATIRPIILRGVVPIYQEREVVLGQLNYIMNHIIAERRNSMSVVD